MKNSIIKFAISFATGLMLIALSVLVLANGDIETVVNPDEVMAAPLQPQKVEPPAPQQGPPDQWFPRKTTSVRQQTGPGQPGTFLTGPNAGDPVDIALDYIRRNRQALGLTEDDLADIVVKDHYVSKHNGVTHIYFRQRAGGIEVFNGDININISRDGEVINMGNAFVSDLSNALNVDTPSLTAIEAVRRAAQHLGVTITEPLVPRRSIGGPAQEVVLSNGGISWEDIPAKLMYMPHEERGGAKVRLVWDLVIELRNSVNWWDIRVDAVTGDVLSQNDWIAHDTYTVYAVPKEHPNDGPRTMEVNPADATASPYGWHDIDGAAGAEYTDTRGNNVFAQEDADANNTGGFRPDGGAGLVFDFPLDLGMAPSTYVSASITNLFYWNNILHDIHYQYGFDEASGNFQQNNYNNGGASGDPVQADAQDGSGVNNANFGTPPDGIDPRMQMYIWTPANPDRDSDLDNGVIAHEYGHGVSNRLTGGPNNVSCLNNAEQMGEGWSDLDALFLTAAASDTGDTPRGVGTYVLNQPPDGPGIRVYPYTTNVITNPHTYDDIKTAAIPHGIGEVWATMVWEVYWNMVTDYGFDPDFYNGTGGNNLTMQLVMDGMKFQPCNPGFVDGRDAILLADQVNNGGVNQCRIWEAFAKRGLGFSADQGSSFSRGDGTEAFDIPLQCLNELFVTKTADPDPAILGGELTYILVATNNTLGTLTGVTLTDTVPMSTTYVPGSASDGGSESGGVVQWSLGTMASGDVATRTFKVTVDSIPLPVFFDDMESGGSNWTTTGLWHLEDDVDACGNSFSASTSFYYGQSPGCNYNTGATNSGRLTTASSIALPASGNPVLTFQSWEETENFAPYDYRRVYISTNGTTFTQIFNSTNNDADWYKVQVDLSAYAGQNVWLRFEFNTLDGIANSYTGWYIDDVRVGEAASIANTASVTASEGDSDTDTINTPVIEAAILEYSPGTIEETMELNQMVTNTITLSNTGTLPLNFSLMDREIPSSCNLVNHDFETGDFTGWIRTFPGGGTWLINDGTYTRNVDGATTPPVAGSFSAMTDQVGPDLDKLYQDITLPATLPGIVTLNWIDQWENHAGVFASNQEYRVELYGPGGAPFLGELFSTNSGNPTLSGPTTRSVDITALVAPYAGQSVRVQFLADVNLYYFNIQVDDVECNTSPIWASTSSISGTIGPLSSTTIDVVFDSNTIAAAQTYMAELVFSGNMGNSVTPMPLLMHIGAGNDVYLPIITKE